MESSSKNEIISLLVRRLAGGELRSEDVLPVLEELVGPSDHPLSCMPLIQTISQEESPAWCRLREAIHRKLLKDALTYHDLRRQGKPIQSSAFPDLTHLPLGAPLGWREDDPLVGVARKLMHLTLCRYFLKSRTESLPVIRAAIEERWQDSWAKFLAHEARWEYLHPDPAEATVSDESRLLEDAPRRYAECAGDQAKRQEVLDAVLTCPSDESAAVLLSLSNEPWERERASLVLMLRFGKLGCRDWRDWARFLTTIQDLRRSRCQTLRRITEEHGDELRLLWTMETDLAGMEELEAREIERARLTVEPEDFVNRWHQSFGPDEINRLLGPATSPPPLAEWVPAQKPRPVLPPILAKEAMPRVARGADAAAFEAPAVPEEHFSEAQQEPEIPEPPRPSVWHDHIQPFIAENWYMVAGLAMVLVGASLLAYYTWDREWYWRYSVMPALLAMLTMALGRTGAWLEERSESARGAGMLLRGAAMGLLPVNFMAVALAASDPAVVNKALVIPVMASIYFAFFGWHLRQWCASVLPSLGWLQGASLLFLNTLVAIGPLARGLGGDEGIRVGLAMGFYIGFAVLAGSLIRFGRNVLTAELVAEKRVPWFFAGTLALTYLQVFAWVHWTMGVVPLPSFYAVLSILAGGLVLWMERRFIELRPTAVHRDAESFLGFALVLMGVLMGMRQPELRVAVCSLAGVVWLRQAGRREGLLHHWIGLTLLMFGGVSVGLLEEFPKNRESNWLPWLGLALALATGLLRFVAGKRGAVRLEEAANEFQPTLLVLTAVVSILSQWKLRSAPLETAAALMLTAGYFAYRATCVRRLSWVHTTLVLLALSLPYLGCVDMQGRSLHGNTMVFGLGVLSALWLLLVYARPVPLLIQARSTVLWTFGAFAMAAMLVRVVLEQGTPGDALWHRAAMDFSGPFIMASVLVCAAYCSRSLIPSAMAAVILAVLFPELNSRFREDFPVLSWGTGLGSSVSALGLALALFPLKRWPLLQNLGEGDLFLGTRPFPLRRYDPTLFVLPILGTILFLVLRVDLWMVGSQRVSGGVGLKTASALGLTGVVWILLAIHGRATEAAKGAVHASWVAFLLALQFAYPRLAATLGHAPQWQMPVFFTGVLLQALYWVYGTQTARHPWVEPLLKDTTRTVLSVGSLIVTGLCVLVLLWGERWTNVGWLVTFLAAQLAWHGFKEGTIHHGIALFGLTLMSLLSWTAVGQGSLIHRLSWEQTFTPVLGFIAAIEVSQLLLEWSPRWRDRLRPLQIPFKWGGMGVMLLASFGAFLAILGPATLVLTTLQQGLLLGTLLLSARANRSGAILLAGVLLGYLFIQASALSQLDPLQRVVLLLMPWRAALLGLFMAALAFVGCRVHAVWPKWMGGGAAEIEPPFPPRFWMLLPSAALVCQATAYQTLDPVWRMSPAQLSAPYIGALADLFQPGARWGKTHPRLVFFVAAAGHHRLGFRHGRTGSVAWQEQIPIAQGLGDDAPPTLSSHACVV